MKRQVLGEVLDTLRRTVALRRLIGDTTAVDRDKPELRSDEEGVRKNQQCDRKESECGADAREATVMRCLQKQ